MDRLTWEEPIWPAMEGVVLVVESPGPAEPSDEPTPPAGTLSRLASTSPPPQHLSHQNRETQYVVTVVFSR